MRKVLLIIDAQYDFLEGGNLPVTGAKGIMDDVARYIEKYGDQYSHIIFTMDQHPFNHCSFKGNIHDGKEGIWPIHCVRYTKGAAIYDPIMKNAMTLANDKGIKLVFLEKGYNPIKEEYSAFGEINQPNRMAFADVVLGNDVEQIDILGLTGDYCLKSSTEDLLKLGYGDKINVMEEFCPSIDDGSTLHKFIEEYKLKK